MLNAIANTVAKPADNNASVIPNMNKNILVTIKNTNPSKLNENIIPGILTNPHDATSIHISVINVLFSIIVPKNAYPNIATIIQPTPVDESPFTNDVIANIKNKIANIEGQIKEWTLLFKNSALI